MKNIVTIGGGTGTFVVLSGLRRLPDVSLTAVVSAADDGGSTGHLRDAYGFLPAGDARQALVALAEDGNVLRDLFAYRFTKSDIKGHNLGNLFITALTDLLGSDSAAIAEASRILRIQGQVLTATDMPTVLEAVLADGTVLRGEAQIDERKAGRSSITKLSLVDSPPVSEVARGAVAAADVIILGPGDLYTSTAATLLPIGMREAVRDSKAKLVYIANLFTKPGQTDGYTVSDHVREIAKYAGREPDHILVNVNGFTEDALKTYIRSGEVPLTDDLPQDDPRVYRSTFVSMHPLPAVENDPLPRSLIRHDSEKVASVLQTILI